MNIRFVKHTFSILSPQIAVPEKGFKTTNK